MKNPEKGAGWEIVREYTDPDSAIMAGYQVLDLVTAGSRYIQEYERYARPGQIGVNSYKFYAWHPGTYPEFPDTIQSDIIEAQKSKELIDIHRKAAKVVGSFVTASQINIFEEGGHTWRHRDRFAGETFVVSLLGLGLVQIKDPVFETKHCFEVYPGDALRIINPRKQSDRPLHKAINIGDGLRVTLVE